MVSPKKSLLNNSSLYPMDTEQIKQQLPKDPNLQTMEESVIYGFFLFFAKKTSIDQRPSSFLKLIYSQNLSHSSLPCKKVNFRRHPQIPNYTF